MKNQKQAILIEFLPWHDNQGEAVVSVKGNPTKEQVKRTLTCMLKDLDKVTMEKGPKGSTI